MKKNILFLLVLMSAVIVSCTSKNNTADQNTMIATDSSMMANDNTQHAVTGATSPSSAMTTTPDTSSTSGTKKVDMANPNLNKKGKNGKVSIEMEPPVKGEMAADKEGYYTNVEVLPAYKGGQRELEHFFEKNIQYPQDASDNGIEGTVRINFAVDENGKIYAPKLSNEKIGYGIEQEALRVFSKMPAWTPGKIKGKNVKTRFTLPVKFQLL